MWAKAELRARARTWVALAVLLAAVGGMALSGATGARRTATVYDRLSVATHAHDLMIQVNDDIDPRLLKQVAALPQVEASGGFAYIPADAGTTGVFSWNVSTAAAKDHNLGVTIDRGRLVAGRRPNPARVDEVAVSGDFLRVRNLKIGQTFTMRTPNFDELFQLFGGRPPIPTGPTITVRIVGVVLLPLEANMTEQNKGVMYLTPAFYERYREETAPLDGLMVRLNRGNADVPAFTAAARKLAGSDEVLGFETTTEVRDKIDRSLAVPTVGLWVFAGLLIIALFVLGGQILGRAIIRSAEEISIASALGATRRRSILMLMVPPAIVAFVGALGAVLVGALTSGLFPVGSLAALEPTPGVEIDPPVLAIGAVVVAVVVLLRGSFTAVWWSRRRDEQAVPRPSWLPNLLSRIGASPALISGARFALEPGRGRSSVPVRSVIGGVALAVAAVVATLTFDSSFELLLDRPHLYGWTFDAVSFGGEDPEVAAENAERIRSSGMAEGVSRIAAAVITVRGETLPVAAISEVFGSVGLGMREGRAPHSPDEVALGSATMRKLGVSIGDTVPLPLSKCASGVKTCARPFTVTGRVLFWTEDAEPGIGALVDQAGFDDLLRASGYMDLLVDLKPGITVEKLERRLAQSEGSVLGARAPVSVQNLSRARGINQMLSAVLGGLAVAIVALSLWTSVRRRRRDLAILKVLGFRRAQVRAATAWTAGIQLIVAMLIGVPVGLVAGRWGWRLVADGLAVVPVPSTPAALIASLAAGLLAIGVVVAQGPARTAARVEAGITLRAK